MKWALELSEYDIGFEPRTTMKGQAVANFIAELTPYRHEVDNRAQWTLYVDDSSNDKSTRVSMLLLGLGNLRFE